MSRVRDRCVQLALPPGWHRRRDLAPGVVVAARPRVAPVPGPGPELVVRCTVVDTDLLTWRAEVLAELARRLDDFALEDAAEPAIGPHRVAYRRFAHRLGDVDVLSEQWAWLVDGVGVTLTGSVAREQHRAYRSLFEAVAASVDVLPLAA